MSFSFSGCGFLAIYHIGVASCLKQHAPQLIHSAQFAGASAGSMIGACLISGCCLGDCTTFVLKLATKARSYSLGPLHPSFNISRILYDALYEVLPENAHKIASGRLFISLTRLSDKKNVLVSEYRSKKELIQAMMCSAHIPFYCGLIPPTYRGIRYVDGGVSDNLPLLDDNTITVSPFAGESDICPSDDSANFQHIMIVNQSVQLSARNLYRVTRALFPPHPEILSEICKQGFDDCLKFLQKNNLLSCTRHLSVRSSIVPVEWEEKHRGENADNAGEHQEDCPDGNCEECKRAVQVALVDTLHPAVVTALQTACDSVNRGVSAYIQRHPTLRVLRLLATPWILPIDLIYNSALRFLESLPTLPQSMQMTFEEVIEALKDLCAHLYHRFHHHHRYHARFTCQLAITEVNYEPSGSAEDTLLFGPYQPQPLPPRVRNLNIGFAVDFESNMPNPVQSVRELEGSMENLDIDEIEIQSSAQGNNVRYHADRHRPQSGKKVDSQEIFDTFEQCLQVSNQMDSAMAYYYRDEGNSQCYNFQEIFNLENVGIALPDSSLDDSYVFQSPVNDGADVDLSWDSFVDMKPEIENELEGFIENTLCGNHSSGIESGSDGLQNNSFDSSGYDNDSVLRTSFDNDEVSKS